MNAQGANLGKELQEFKNSTMSLPGPYRGHKLDTNDFIRAIHNSVARYVPISLVSHGSETNPLLLHIT